jgi:serine protease
MLRTATALLAALVATTVFGLSGAAAVATPRSPELLPDLDQEYPSDLRVIVEGSRVSPFYLLGFTSAVRNIGKGPLIIRGHRADDQTPFMQADQVIARGDGSDATVPAIGEMHFVVSPDHQHWHYVGFDRYQIYELRGSGLGSVVARDQKTGFCLGDRYRARVTLAERAPRPVFTSRCGLHDSSLLTVQEGISVGYGDAYQGFLEGQDLPLTGLPDGRYVLVHRTNSDRRIREINYANDAASVLLDLHWRNGVPYLRELAVCPQTATCAERTPQRVPPRAHTSADFVPDDPGWSAVQWNFDGPYGVDAPRAWSNLIAAGAPGGAGVTVAVLDTGVAYTDIDGFAMSPDFASTQFVPGWDFVDNDAYPVDENGHGTHVASTIAEETNNGLGLTGLAYGARIMPVRVLDRNGEGDAVTIARGVVWAVDHGAQVVNLSLNFDPSVQASQIPQLLAAFAYAERHGVIVVAAAGNDGLPTVDFPARASGVLSVGATTDWGCLAAYSNYGADLDVVAPGGGDDAGLPGDPRCLAGRPGGTISQMTFGETYGRFEISDRYYGTSMAAAHVSAIAALVLASGVLHNNASPARVVARIEATARDLGKRGRDVDYGWGLVDAGAATAPSRVVPTER